MASIPNLNTLRRGRGGPRLRDRRGGNHGLQSEDASNIDTVSANDKIVQQTDQDASSSRLSAVELGYLHDDYARAFSTGETHARRYPLINRGTYVRTTAIDRLVNAFIASKTQRKQIISLGAGSDTRFYRINTTGKEVIYHEIDFESNIATKKSAIDRSTHLTERRNALEANGSTLHFHALDLRRLNAEDLAPHVERDVPTLILSECCLCYLSPEEADRVVTQITSGLSGDIALILYEPIRPFDAFGKTMVSNLASRGIHMQTLKRYASLEAQRHRLKLAGFQTGQGALDVLSIWNSIDWTPETERERIEKIEWLDEVEEWNLLASHYCVAWGFRGEGFVSAWSQIDGAPTENERRKDQV